MQCLAEWKLKLLLMIFMLRVDDQDVELLWLFFGKSFNCSFLHTLLLLWMFYFLTEPFMSNESSIFLSNLLLRLEGHLFLHNFIDILRVILDILIIYRGNWRFVRSRCTFLPNLAGAGSWLTDLELVKHLLWVISFDLWAILERLVKNRLCDIHFALGFTLFFNDNGTLLLDGK